MNWRFWKKPTAPNPIDDRIWNDDWQVGDTAECIANTEDWAPEWKPWERLAKGSRWTVVGFSEAIGIGRGKQAVCYFLRLEGVPDGCQYPTKAFRKVRPQAKQHSEVVERILTAKPGADRVRETSA